MDLRKWLRGLLGAVLNTVGTSVALIVVDPARFNLFGGGASELGKVAVVSMILGAALYLKEHPIDAGDERPPLIGK